MKNQLLPLLIILLSLLNNNLQSQSLIQLKDSVDKYNYYYPIQAISFHQQILSIYQKNKDWNPYVLSLSEILGNYFYLNDIVKTEEYLNKTLNAAEKYNFPIQSNLYSYLWNISGVIAGEKGNFEGALEFYKKSLAIDSSLANISRSDMAISYNNIASIYSKKGDYRQAIYYYERSAFYENKKKNETNISDLISLSNNIAYNYNKLGHYEKANQFYQQGLQYISSKNINNPIYYSSISSIYINTAINFQSLGQFENTSIFLTKTEQLEHLTKKDQATIYKHRGTTLLKQNQYVQSLDALTKALKIRKKHYSSNKHHVLSITHQAIAEVHLAQNNYTKALNNYQKAIQSVVYDFSNNDININPKLDKILNKVELLKALSAKAKVLKLQNKNQLALETYQLCTQLIDQMRSSFEHNASKLFLIEQGIRIYEQAIETAIRLNKKELAYELAEKSKSMLLLEATRGIEARFGLPDELLDKERIFKVDIAYYERQIWKEEQKNEDTNQEEIKKWQNIIFDLKEKYSALKEQFEKDYPDYFQLQYDSQVASVKDIQRKLLNRKTAMVSYFFGEEKNYIFTITKKDIKIVVLDKNDDLNEWVDNLRLFLKRDSRLSNAYATFYTTGFQLYQAFLSPALKPLPKSIQQLIVIPDGQLSFIPFEVLLTSKSTFSEARYEINQIPYLIRDYQISYGYSATLLLEGRKRKQKKELKTFGGFIPQFGGETSETRGCDDGTLGNLAFGRENILSINQIMDGRLHFDEEATLGNFKMLAEQYKILHLCTHACAEMDFKDTRIYFTDEELLAFELYSMPLNAQLAVLSACETGIGEYKRGEGVMSLARAFMYSGCPSVVTSLWSVDDKSTSEIMRHFYKNIKNGLPKDKALHQAKLDYLDGKRIKQSHPYYWSAFVQIGNTEALFENKAKRKNWWLYIFLILMTIAGLFFWKKKKK